MISDGRGVMLIDQDRRGRWSCVSEGRRLAVGVVGEA